LNELAFGLLTNFGEWREQLISEILVPDFFELSNAIQVANEGTQKQALDYYHALLALPVAMKGENGCQSVLGDMVWDFNPNHPDAARNVSGAKLRMDWSKYTNVTPTVMLEIKVAFVLYHLAPSHIYPNKRNKKGSLKANTIISIFTDGMQFVNELSIQDHKEFGREIAVRSGQSIKDFDMETYRLAAGSYRFKYSNSLKIFGSIIKSHYLAENVFGGYVPHVDLDTLPWVNLTKDNHSGADAEKSSDILPNSIFERASLAASFLVVDFLEAMGEEVSDIDTLRRRNARAFRKASDMEITSSLLDLYTFMRLKQKGYDGEAIDRILDGVPKQLLTTRPGIGVTTVCKKTMLNSGDGLKINEALRLYLNLVNYSCCYLVAQFTGMRPSELANIELSSCIEADGSYWLLKSRVVKHRQSYGKLFDDKWVAIPVIRDAIAVAKILARYKQSPYLFSTVDTLAPGAKSKPLNSLGIHYQLNSFFKSVLSDEEYLSLDFSPYTLRHTLAYQLYRAEVGLPFISHQLKHFGDVVGGYGSKGYSPVTLGYGHIGDLIEAGGRQSGDANRYRTLAETEIVKLHYDPEGTFAGSNADSHKARNQRLFQDYEAAGYTRDEVYAALVDKGIAVVSIGMGICYGGRVEEFDESLPCIGGLRCNPNRCSNSVITKAHAPKWREIYTQNTILLADSAYEDRRDQIESAIKEAAGVLKYLGEELDIDV